MTRWYLNNPKVYPRESRQRDGFGASQCLKALARLFLVISFLGITPPAFSEVKVLFPFQGEIDFRQKRFLLSMTSANKDSVSLDISQHSASEYNVLINIDHFKTSIFEISSVFECPLNMTYDADKNLAGLRGKLWSKYTLIDYRPVRELSGQFEFKDRTLFLSSLNIGSLTGQGFIKFAEPYTMNLVLKLEEIDAQEFLNFWMKDNSAPVSGKFSGQTVLSGSLNRLQVRGNFVGYNGVIKDSAFDNLQINFEGIYPTVTLVNSTGIKPDGMPFTITGIMDLSDRSDFGAQFRALSKQPIVEQEGENLEWTFKRMRSEPGSGTTTELKYMKKKGTGDTGITSDEDAMLGVERSIPF